jgi:hypothetical protein
MVRHPGGLSVRAHLIAGLLMVALAGAAAAADSDRTPLEGQDFDWSVASGGQCHEHWAFGADGVMTITSGEEVTAHSYAVDSGYPAGMYRLQSTRITSNGQPDCQGNADASVGQTREIYLVFLNGGGFFTCASTDTMSCSGVASPSAAPSP